ncbi:uncharacterized protein LOC126843379 [Adelges cooleyi]|uniref:uncharacterized protein LOC126843379 n=1 Tax=Adelges cooleyi TaxID=133065 RepID=UPI00217FFBBB|nr:uncharacterized protein LOC126843379 [Adelges cooleyi]XP_050436839.1 uncharacterized protein LOC126843379 [Adelges cooleyi]XP_050436841.1 uncharacterized protein LOC126843379 [Adelges cooleyi]XP_050436842.1 uncharacterized protein LOC126843379 [Adelges cooleyi]
MESISTALNHISSDKGRICGSLHYVRTNIISRPEGINELRELGGIRILVKCLKQVNPKVLSLTLSILGNCSMDESCREQLFECGIIKDLAFIMKNINVDNIHNRTCRMVANLAISQVHIPNMYKHNIPNTVISILAYTNCNGTRFSAIRALRKIWENSSKTGCTEMLKNQAIAIISELLFSDCSDIVSAVLRAQLSFLANAGNPKHLTNNQFVVLQILGKDVKNTMTTLMNLLPNNPIASKIIYLLSKVRQTRMQLALAGTMERIVDYLEKENNHYLTVSLCLLCECPSNRGCMTQWTNGLSVILDLISGTNPIYKELAMTALTHFRYDKRSLEEMVKKGLISMLIKNLSSYIEANKMPNLCPPETKTQSQSTLSFVSYSPAGSSGMSPYSPPARSLTPPINENIATDSYSPCYSPVCGSFDGESINADSRSDISDYEVKEDDKEIETPDKQTGDNIIIFLLKLLSYQKFGVNMMGSKDVWQTILDYILYIEDSFDHEKPQTILQMIVLDVINFKTILTEGFIVATHQKLCQPEHDLNLCKNCKNRHSIGLNIIKSASVTYESMFAEDVMTSIMNERDRQYVKSLVSVTTPLVIQSKPPQLLSMLFRYNVFDNLCSIIKDTQHELFNHSVGALIALFKTSNIVYTSSFISRCEDQNCCKTIVKKETTVVLALDDGTLVNANKSFLSLKSPMFEAMFRCGGFMEAYQKTIRLNDVSAECFKLLLDLLEVCCECMLPKDVKIVLELIVVADRYMLDDLAEQLNMIMMNSIMSLENCSMIYEWAKETGYSLKFGSTVSLDVIKYLLTSNSSFPRRVESIKKIINSQCGQHFVDDFTDVLKYDLVNICDDQISKFYLNKFAN